MAYCSSCGTQLIEHACFCSQCGAAIQASYQVPGNTPKQSEEAFLARLFDASGRSTRLPYALTLLGSLAVAWLLAALLIILLAALQALAGVPEIVATLLILPLWLLLILTWVIAHIRRLHDRGHSGWGVFLFLIPFVGFLLLLYLLFAPSVQRTDPASGQRGELRS